MLRFEAPTVDELFTSFRLHHGGDLVKER